MISEKKLRKVQQHAEFLHRTVVSEEEKISNMVEFAKKERLYSVWFHVDEAIRKRFERMSWFWIIRRVRNIKSID